VTNKDFFVQTWDREQPKFDRVMDALPPDRLDYRPHPKSRSGAEMATLLARFQEILVGMIDRGEVHLKDFGSEDFAEMRSLWKKSTERVREGLKNLDDDAWQRPVKFFMGGKVINEAPTSNLMWGFLHDMIHHRGQLTAYIRPMGGKVPSIYGPSADAAPSR
jgi:uncharacterized damage-inducible protein DinB